MANDDGTFSPFQVNGLDAPRFPDADCQAAGGYPSGSLCRMDFSDQRTSIAAERRPQLFAEVEFDPSKRLSLFAELGYSENAVTDRVGNMLLFNGNVERTNEFFVPARHPFNFWTDPDGDGVLAYVPPEAWRPGVHEAVDLGYFGRPLGAEASGDNAGHERRRYDNLRALAGVTARLSDTWTGTAHLTRAQSKLGVAADRHWVAAEFARKLGTRNDTNGFGPTPELRFNLGLSWVRGRHDANVTLRHIDAYRNDEVASLPEIDAWTTVDLSYAYSFPGPFGGEATVSVGANNATDEDPPPLPSGRDGAQRYNLRPGFDGFVHDIKGREAYVGFRWRR